MRHALVTGGAGFIGSHLVDSLIADGWRVTVFDRRPPTLAGLILDLGGISEQIPRWIRGDLRFWPTDFGDVARGGPYDVIVHLAARAGVRASIDDAVGCQDTNVMGTQHLLEFARDAGGTRFVFASSSSVYGDNPATPWLESDDLRPLSPYAASKVAGEAIGRVYAHLHRIQFTALRFFTVYGPRQRPDLAIRSFADDMLAGKPITVYGDGSSRRDYTYVDDIVSGIRAAMAFDAPGFHAFNLGNTHAIPLATMIAELQRALGVRAAIRMAPERRGDARVTRANIDKAKALLGWEPRVSFEDGLRRFAAWRVAEEARRSALC